MEELDKLDWNTFRLQVNNKLNKQQFELVCTLHAKYFNHKYHKPCSCSPKKIISWIDDLNNLYDTNREDK